MNLLSNREKLVSYFLNNTAKAYLQGLEISENIEIGHSFSLEHFFYLSNNLHTSCLCTFKCYVIKQCRKKIFIVRNTITLQAGILDCSEAAVHSLSLFLKIYPENTGGRVFLLIKFQTSFSEYRLYAKVTPPRIFFWKSSKSFRRA